MRLQQQQPQQAQELRLKLQQEDELCLRQHERTLDYESRKTEADEEQKFMEIELTKKSLRASGSQADNLETVESRRKLKKRAGWATSVAQQSGLSRLSLQML